MARLTLVFAAVLALLSGPVPFAGPALALTCETVSPQDVFWTFQDREETYVAALGAFSDLRKLRHDRAKDQVIWRATFRGHRAGDKEFDVPFVAEVEIVQPLWTAIFGPGGDTDALARTLPGQTGIVYLEQRPQGLRITQDICRPMMDPNPASIRPTLRCLRGAGCPRSR